PALWVEAAVFSMPRWTLLNVLVALLMVPTSMISASIVIRNGPLSGNAEASATWNDVSPAEMLATNVVLALFAAFNRGISSPSPTLQLDRAQASRRVEAQAAPARWCRGPQRLSNPCLDRRCPANRRAQAVPLAN